MKDLLEAVNLYFEGIHECDVFKLKEVFHPESGVVRQSHTHLKVL